MKAFVIAAKPAAPLTHKANMLLDILQKDVRRRFKSYKRGGMQGLPMIWDNMMGHLKEQYEKDLKKDA